MCLESFNYPSKTNNNKNDLFLPFYLVSYLVKRRRRWNHVDEVESGDTVDPCAMTAEHGDTLALVGVPNAHLLAKEFE